MEATANAMLRQTESAFRQELYNKYYKDTPAGLDARRIAPVSHADRPATAAPAADLQDGAGIQRRIQRRTHQNTPLLYLRGLFQRGPAALAHSPALQPELQLLPAQVRLSQRKPPRRHYRRTHSGAGPGTLSPGQTRHAQPYRGGHCRAR